ncbi:MAG: CheY-like chemotaxis protein/nitrogen-specific signal transduction histidine kinase [Candidatus Omnitrophota bacterium]|jgi:CheY-like chemotaxis protein/nitrogen-specific signal transduction histidine kinase/HPt (histidine-containing phosphotransfer) domain-containing protein
MAKSIKDVILVIDDEESVLASLEALLSDVGFEIITADSYENAVRVIDENDDIEAILCDIKLPGKSGHDVLTFINKRELRVPLIFLTGYGTIKDCQSALKEGAFDFILKPVTEREHVVMPLLHAIENYKLKKKTHEMQKKMTLMVSEKQGLLDALVSDKKIGTRVQALIEETARIHEEADHVEEDSPTTLQLVRTLIVNDYSDSASFLKALLNTSATFKFDVDRANSLSMALDAIGSKEYDVILLDIYLPDSIGINTVKTVFDAAPHMPIIAITSIDSEQFAADVLSGGAEDYLVKGNFDDSSLLRSIRYSIERKKHRISSEATSDFLAHLSHEARNSLSTIVGMTEILTEIVKTSEQRQYLNAISSDTEQLLVIMNEVLDLSKIEESKLELDIMSFDLRLAIENTVDSLFYSASKKDLNFNCYVDDKISTMIKGDPGRLKQIITNLASNAIKFTHKGDITLSVAVASETDETMTIQFSCKDTGIGIPKGSMDRVFEKFEQVNPGAIQKHGGAGLGLAISKSLVELMGGEFTLTSVEGKGSEFGFVIDFMKDYDALSTKPKPLERLNGLSILIIDADKNNCEILGKYLSSENCETTFSHSYNNAIQILHEHNDASKPFDVIISTDPIGDKSVFELTQEIRQDENFGDLRIVLLSQLGNRGDANKCKELGINAYLVKPVKRGLLIDTLRYVLNPELNPDEIAPLITQHNISEIENKNVHILVAEDSAANRRVACHHLRKSGYTVDEASDGQIAVNLFKTKSYDLIITDITMPNIDGVESSKMMRRIEKETGAIVTPIIAMTAHGMLKDLNLFKEAGIDSHITKPVRKNELLGIVEAWVVNKQENKRLLGNLIAVADKSYPLNRDGAVRPPMDLKIALDEFDHDQSMLEDMLQDLFDIIPKRIIQIENALFEENLEVVFRESHTIKGESANIFAEDLSKAAYVLEQLGEAGDLKEGFKQLNKLKQEFYRLKTYCGDFVFKQPG